MPEEELPQLKKDLGINNDVQRVERKNVSSTLLIIFVMIFFVAAVLIIFRDTLLLYILTALFRLFGAEL